MSVDTDWTVRWAKGEVRCVPGWPSSTQTDKQGKHSAANDIYRNYRRNPSIRLNISLFIIWGQWEECFLYITINVALLCISGILPSNVLSREVILSKPKLTSCVKLKIFIYILLIYNFEKNTLCKLCLQYLSLKEALWIRISSRHMMAISLHYRCKSIRSVCGINCLGLSFVSRFTGVSHRLTRSSQWK